MTTAELPPTMPLGEAREWLRERVDDGEHCPCCTQLAKVYRRKLSVAAARTLLLLYRNGGVRGYVDLPRLLERQAPDLASQGGYATLGHWWGLIEQMPGTRDDGSSHTGMWRVTDLGIDFVEERRPVPKYARLYDGRCLGLVGDPIGIREALGTRFNYSELMAGV